MISRRLISRRRAKALGLRRAILSRIGLLPGENVFATYGDLTCCSRSPLITVNFRSVRTLAGILATVNRACRKGYAGSPHFPPTPRYSRSRPGSAAIPAARTSIRGDSTNIGFGRDPSAGGTGRIRHQAATVAPNELNVARMYARDPGGTAPVSGSRQP